MNFRKTFKEKNKNGYYLLLLFGIVLPMLIPFAFCIFGKADVPAFWSYVITFFLIFWLLAFPCLCRLYYYSLFYYRLTISLSLIIPFVLPYVLRSSEVVQKLDQLDIFMISAGIIWLLILILLWIYDGYLISKKPK
jgi:hypothetical protein